MGYESSAVLPLNENAERDEWSPEAITETVNAEITKRVSERFADRPEEGPNRARFMFHNPEHPQNVLRNAKRIVQLARENGSMADSDDEATLAVEVGALAHDMVIRFREITDKASPRYGEIDRYRGWEEHCPTPIKDVLAEEIHDETVDTTVRGKGNEQASWEELERVIDEIDPQKKVYTPRVRELAKAEIAATYPDSPYPFPEFPEGSTIIRGKDIASYLFKTQEGKPSGLKFDQPELTYDSPIAVLAVALGDLAYGGNVDAEGFQKHGDEEWAETHPLMVRKIEAGIVEKQDADSVKEKIRIVKSMTGWQSAQPGFLLWQKIRFEDHLMNNRKIAALGSIGQAKGFRSAMREEYKNFDDNILATATRVDDFKKFGKLTSEEFHANPETAHEAHELFNEIVHAMHLSVSA